MVVFGGGDEGIVVGWCGLFGSPFPLFTVQMLCENGGEVLSLCAVSTRLTQWKFHSILVP